MSGFIDYSSRRSKTARPTYDEDDEPKRPTAAAAVAQPEATAATTTTTDNTATKSEDPFAEPSQPQPAAVNNANDTVRSTASGPFSDSQQPAAYPGGASGHVDVEKETVVRDDYPIQNDFTVEHQQTEGGPTAPAPIDEAAHFDPTFDGYEDEAPLEMPFFDHNPMDYDNFSKFEKLRINIRQGLSYALTLGAMGLVIVCAFGYYFNPMKIFKKGQPRAKADREYERRITGERASARPAYYAEFWGYKCDEHEIVTEGGWVLKAHRISDPRRPGPPGYPVVLQHGILCNSLHFLVNEERSMAFWLVDQGYDVWVTNIRANFGARHTKYERSDPRFWAWGLKELAFDLRDVVEFICGATGSPKLAYVGHSQGSGSMYLALSPGICPEIGKKLSCFVALGPSVYAGPVLRQFPFSLMRQFRSRKWWSLIFGIKEFIPIIGLFHQYLPAFWFGHLAYVIFSFLFSFHDHNWVQRQKPKFFRSLPVGTSSELLYWYMSGFSHRGCIFDPRITEPWFGKNFPAHSIYYGSIDYLVIGKPLIKRVQQHETNLKIVHAVELEGYEHLDMIFGVDAWRTVFPGIHDTILTSMPAGSRRPEMTQR